MTKLLDPPKAKPKEPTHDPGPAPARPWRTAPDVPPALDLTKSVRQLLIEDAARGEAEIVPLPVEVYESIVRAGWEDTSVELLDGLLIRKDRGDTQGKGNMVGQGEDHAIGVTLLARLLPTPAEAHGGHFRGQVPNRLPSGSEPEPDGMIVRGEIRAYRRRPPTPADCSCVIEVSDSSLRRDRTRKLRLYAAAGVPQYVIENLVDEVLEVRERPRGQDYEDLVVVGRGGSVGLLMPDGSRVSVAADDLLP